MRFYDFSYFWANVVDLARSLNVFAVDKETGLNCQNKSLSLFTSASLIDATEEDSSSLLSLD